MKYFVATCLILLLITALPQMVTGCTVDIWDAKMGLLKGVVATEDFATIEGAEVRVFKLHKSRPEDLVAQTKSDSNGNFSIPNLKDGQYQVRVKSEHFETTYVTLRLSKSRGDSSAKELFVTLLPFGLCTGTANVRSIEPKNDYFKYSGDVKREFLHAWNGYKKYAWGNDDLKPLSKSYHNWYAQPLLMTPVDALDTMYLMGLKNEADKTREYIRKTLNFDKDISVQKFEIVIRLLGGLLSSYQITGDKELLRLADDLGTRLLPAFESSTGLPYKHVNLRTGKVATPISNPAETGTLLIEFGTLSKLTGKPVYYEKAKRALVETYKRRSPIGLVGTRINVETGEWTNTGSHLSAEIDSYYEYLFKCWKLFGDAECKQMWDESIPVIHKYLADEVDGQLWYGHADMATGKRTRTTWGALDAFFPGVLALSGDLDRAKRLQDSSFKMWQVHGIEPEVFNYRTMKVEHAGYPLRPEIVESTYVLYQLTKDPKYLAMGKQMWDDFVKNCRTDVGYAHLKSVITKEKNDAMQSFVLAETFKYFYLLFAPEKTLDFKKVVFNTEAHPIRRTW